jgi:predicted esterase
MGMLMACWVAGSLALPAASAAQSAAPAVWPKGVLVDPVASPSEPGQRYVVYLPTTIDPGTPAPILYILDYRGRGRVAAELFQPAAERFGWILMSSYNSISDGTGQPNALAIRTMWRDSHDLFPVDDRRAYLAGLSGTARQATFVASRSGGRFAGVIGAAAGFAPDTLRSDDARFLYYGTAGTTDYNYWEMRGLATRLARLGIPHRIAFFDGAHAWMPSELAFAAVAWMELRAMGAGLRAIDRGVVDERWQRDRERVGTLEAEGLVWEASRLLASMAADYVRLRPEAEIAELTRRAKELGATRVARAQASLQEHAARQHESRIERAMEIVADAYPESADAPAVPLAKTLLDLGIARLRATARGADGDAARAASRVLAELDVQTGFYLPTSALRRKDVDRARYYLGLARAIDPDRAYTWFLTAAVEAQSKAPARALAALERAIDLGFRTIDALDHDPAFESLRKRPDFVGLVNRLREAIRR